MAITLNKTIKKLKREVSKNKLKVLIIEKFEGEKNEITQKKEAIEMVGKIIEWLEELQERREKDEKHCMPEIENLKMADEQVSNYFFRKE